MKTNCLSIKLPWIRNFEKNLESSVDVLLDKFGLLTSLLRSVRQSNVSK